MHTTKMLFPALQQAGELLLKIEMVSKHAQRRDEAFQLIAVAEAPDESGR